MVRKNEQLLTLRGHRNWLGVADAAYPLQIAPGIETILTDADPVEGVCQVLQQLDRAPHVPCLYR